MSPKRLVILLAVLLVSPQGSPLHAGSARDKALKASYTDDYLRLKKRITDDFAARNPAPMTPVDAMQQVLTLMRRSATNAEMAGLVS